MTSPTSPPRKNEASNAPYDPATLQPPLTLKQRQDIITWIWLKEFNGDISSGPSLASMQKESDADLIVTYTKAIQLLGLLGSPITGPPGISNPFSTITDLLKFLLNPVRMGEIIVGFILIGVAVNAALKSSTGTSPVQHVARASTSFSGMSGRR